MSEPIDKKRKTILEEEIIQKLRAGYDPYELNQTYSYQLVDSTLQQIQPEIDAFFYLITTNQLEQLLKMINDGMSPNVRKKNQTPLMVASQLGNFDIVQALLKAGAYPNIRKWNGVTALIMSVITGNYKIVKILLDFAADPNIQENDGYTALLWALDKEELEIAQILLNTGANPNLQDKKMNSPLIFASQLGYLKIVQALLAAGANPRHQNINQNTALILASREGHLEIVQTLLEITDIHNIINLHNINGDTALIKAVKNGHFDIVKILLKAGADPNLLKYNGETAYDLCTGENKSECQQILYNYDKKKKQVRGLVTVGTAGTELPVLPKDVWRTILKRRMQLELCSDLSENANKETLLVMAKTDFNVPENVIEEWRLEKSKRELCAIVSGLLSIGAMYSEKALDFLVQREQFGKAAKIGIQFQQVLKELGIKEDYYDKKTGEERKKSLNRLLEELAMKMRF